MTTSPPSPRLHAPPLYERIKGALREAVALFEAVERRKQARSGKKADRRGKRKTAGCISSRSEQIKRLDL